MMQEDSSECIRRWGGGGGLAWQFKNQGLSIPSPLVLSGSQLSVCECSRLGAAHAVGTNEFFAGFKIINQKLKIFFFL